MLGKNSAGAPFISKWTVVGKFFKMFSLQQSCVYQKTLLGWSYYLKHWSK